MIPIVIGQIRIDSNTSKRFLVVWEQAWSDGARWGLRDATTGRLRYVAKEVLEGWLVDQDPSLVLDLPEL